MDISIICEKAGTAKITVNNNESTIFFIISSYLSQDVKNIIYVLNPFDIPGVFSRQFLLCLTGSILSQGHDAILDGNLGCASALATMKTNS
jgi:hypothetical protein